MAAISPNKSNRHALIAQLLAAAGRYDEALAELSQVDPERLDLTSYFSPEWKPVRNDPRFRQVVERSGDTKAYESALAYIAAHPEPSN